MVDLRLSCIAIRFGGFRRWGTENHRVQPPDQGWTVGGHPPDDKRVIMVLIGENAEAGDDQACMRQIPAPSAADVWN